MKRALRKVKNINVWGIAALLFFLTTLAMFGYYGFMLLESQRLNKLIESRQAEVLEQKRILKDSQKDAGYKKYKSAKLIHSQQKGIQWSENIDYLVGLIDVLSELDRDDSSIMLENFQITDTTISLRGTISSLSTMYREGGIIDKFTEFDFINSLSIPFYRRNGDFFQFVLDAKIRENAGQ